MIHLISFLFVLFITSLNSCNNNELSKRAITKNHIDTISKELITLDSSKVIKNSKRKSLKPKTKLYLSKKKAENLMKFQVFEYKSSKTLPIPDSLFVLEGSNEFVKIGSGIVAIDTSKNVIGFDKFYELKIKGYKAESINPYFYKTDNNYTIFLIKEE